MKKGFILKIHSVAGLLSGLFICLLSISGAALVFHEELDSLQYPQIIHQGNAALLTVDSCYKILQNKYPKAQISNCNIAENSSVPFIFTLYEPAFEKGKEPMQAFLHPQTGEILKIRSGSKDIKLNFMSWLAAFHNSFHANKKGEWLLAVLAIVFIISICTGLFLYRQHIMPVLLFRKSAFKRANLHQIIGVYALIFNLMIAVTGFWMQRYVFKKEFYASYEYNPVLKASPPLSFSLTRSMENIQKDFPGFSGYILYFAQSAKGKTAIYGSRKNNAFIYSKKLTDVISLDSSGHVAGTRFINEISSDDRYDIINSQIHFGKYGGLPVKILYSLFGMLTAMLSFTGFLIWLKRKNSLSLNK